VNKPCEFFLHCEGVTWFASKVAGRESIDWLSSYIIIISDSYG
jgi:hypothetical protein